jgi:apolipoprotein N-acyltransferase
LAAIRQAVDFGRGFRREALAGAPGILLALSFHKFGHGAVAFFALAPLLLALPGSRPGRALWLGYLTGVLWAAGTL